MLVEKVASTIRRFQMIQPGDCVLVAVSGGPDSVALTHVLHHLRNSKNPDFTIALAHLNHQLRAESDEDEAHCVRLAERLGVEIERHRVDVAASARRNRRSLEEAGRLERYRFLSRAARRLGCRRVALGHTRNDQAETLLLRMFRGAGSTGLTAIHPVVDGVFIRPLLETSREEITDFLRDRGIPYRLDATNDDRSIPRNRIRHDVLPYLARHFNPALTRTLARTADLLREEEDWMQQEANRALAEWGSMDGERLRLSVEGLASLHPALARRVVRAAVEIIKGDLRGWNRTHVEDVLRLTSPGKSGRILTLPGIMLGRSFGELWLRRVDAPRPAGPRAERVYWPQDGYNGYEYELSVPGSLEIREAGGVIVAEESRGTPLLTGAGTTVVVGVPEAEEHELRVRNARSGDRFRPLGAPGTKSMFRYLMEQRVSRERRRRIPLVVRGDDILWVAGHGVSERSRVGPGTGRMLQLSWVEE